MPYGATLQAGAESKGSGTFVTTICKVCYNKHGIENRANTPVILETNMIFGTPPATLGIAVVFPHALALVLEPLYDLDEFVMVAESIKPRITDVYMDWMKGQRNPCNWGKVGYEVPIKIRGGFTLCCWMVVDTSDVKITFRVIFGTGKVECL